MIWLAVGAERFGLQLNLAEHAWARLVRHRPLAPEPPTNHTPDKKHASPERWGIWPEMPQPGRILLRCRRRARCLGLVRRRARTPRSRLAHTPVL